MPHLRHVCPALDLFRTDVPYMAHLFARVDSVSKVVESRSATVVIRFPALTPPEFGLRHTTFGIDLVHFFSTVFPPHSVSGQVRRSFSVGAGLHDLFTTEAGGKTSVSSYDRGYPRFGAEMGSS